MMTRGEFGEASSSSSASLSRSPSSSLMTSWSHSSNPHLHQTLFPGDSSSSSSRFCLRSPSDYSISSYFSNGICSSEDGSSQFASPPYDGMMMMKHYKKTSVVADECTLSDHDLGLCESINRLNIREEEEEEKTHQRNFTGNQLINDPNDGGFRFGASSGFGVDKPSLFPSHKWSSANNQIPNFRQSYGKTLDPEASCHLTYKSAEMSTPLFSESSARSMVSSANKSMIEPFHFDNSLIMEANSLNDYSVRSMAHQKSGVGTLFDHQGSGISSSNTHPSMPKISEIQGYVYLMAKDQHGCRVLQRIFEHGTSLDASIIYNEVIPHAVELMTDPFGNYLMQKLLDVCNEEQRTQIVLMVTAEPGQLIRISLNAYGTRVVQRLVESIKTKKQIYLVKSALRPGFLNLIRDVNGNNVVQRCLKCLSTEDNEFIFEDATKFCIDIATHRHGCCVLQKCIAYSTGQLREKLMAEISRNSRFLAKDPYGNYAVQFIIELRDYYAIATVLAHLKGHYVELSMQKFSSHVVERCLTHCPESHLQIVQELILFPRFDLLIQDPYANFVIQAALSVTKGSLHATLVEAIRPYSILRNNPYCKRIFSRNLLKNWRLKGF